MSPANTVTGADVGTRESRALTSIRSSVKAVFGIDLRTLALFRIALATMVIADLALRARDLTAHYSDQGVLPRAALIGDLGLWAPSFHLISGSAKVQAALFLVAAIVALAMLVGYRTRLMTIVSCILLLSLQARNPAIAQGGDLLLYLLLFWGIFLPLGARFSVDAALDTNVREEPDRYFSMATMALLVQCISVYFFGALLKTGSVWIPEGSAVYYALQIDYLATPFAVWLRQFPSLLQALTYLVWGLELVAPALMFAPVLHLPLRLLGLVLLVGMHIGFFLTLNIGLFPFISITSLLAFIPGWVWDRIAARARTPERSGVVIYFDKPCEFCRKVCLILRTFLLSQETPILPAQDDTEIYRSMQIHNSWVVADYDGSHHVRWDAIAVVFLRSPIFWPLGLLFARPFMQPLGDYLYKAVARNRGSLANWSGMRLPYRVQSIHPARASEIVVGGLMILVLLFNVKSVSGLAYRLPRVANDVMSTLRLGQEWTMFAPQPLRIDGWFVVRGETASGPVDVLRGRKGEPDWGRPEHLAHEYPTYRWERFMVPLSMESGAKYRPHYAQYLCRNWNVDKGHESEIRELKIYFNREIILRDYLPRKTERVLIHTQICF